jgi:triosephosphate isomerase (TIM)
MSIKLMIVINYKNYLQGGDVLKLTKQVEKYLPDAMVCVPAFDLMDVADKCKLKVFAQHIDFFDDKRSTGFLLPNSAKKAGAYGTLINHSEHPLFLSNLKRTIELCKKYKLKEIVCVSSFEHLYSIMHMEPYAVAFEDKDLIASGNSITSHNSEDVRKFAALMKDHAKNSYALCGAGISSVEDVKKSRELGCDGVLIASWITNNKRPDKILKSLMRV